MTNEKANVDKVVQKLTFDPWDGRWDEAELEQIFGLPDDPDNRQE